MTAARGRPRAGRRSSASRRSGSRYLSLVTPMPCSPRDHAAQRDGLLHDPVDRGLGAAQHRPVVGHDRDVHVHVAVAGVHVGGQHDEAGAHLPHEPPRRRPPPAGGPRAARPGRREPVDRRRGERTRPSPACGAPRALQRRRRAPPASLPPRARPLGGDPVAGSIVGAPDEVRLAVDVPRARFIASMKRENSASAVERQDDVLVDLEGVGAPGDGAEPLAVGPEALALGGVARLGEVGVRVGEPGWTRMRGHAAAPLLGRCGRPRRRCSTALGSRSARAFTW